MDNNEILAKLQDIIRETVDNEDIEITNNVHIDKNLIKSFNKKTFAFY